VAKLGLYDRVDDAVAEGKLWRAREILEGNLGQLGYDIDLYERLGQVLLQMGEPMQAGRFLFLSGRRGRRYEEAINIYLDRYTRKAPGNLLGTFPNAARLAKVDDYPEAVREELCSLGLARRVEEFKKPGEPTWQRSKFVAAFFATGCLVGLAIAGLCAFVGFAVIGEWLRRLLGW
jgi:Family of unknown function (DUF6584)